MTTVVVLGTGHWAEHVHLPALAGHPPVQLVGLWGRRPERVAELAARHGITAFTSLAEALAAADVVTLAVPPDAQPELATAAAGAGCHLLLEKPLAATPADADRLVGVLSASGVHSRVFLTRLFDPLRARWFDTHRFDTHRFDAHRNDGWTRAHVDWTSGDLLPGRPVADGWRADSGPWLDIAPHVLAELELVLGAIEEIELTSIAADRSFRLTVRHAAGRIGTARIGMYDPVPATRDGMTVSGPSGDARIPVETVDPVAALRAAVGVLLGDIAGTSGPDTPRLALTTAVAGARAVTQLHTVPDLIALSTEGARR